LGPRTNKIFETDKGKKMGPAKDRSTRVRKQGGNIEKEKKMHEEH